MCDWGTHGCSEHISGQGYATGRFNYLEYRRAIDIFLQLKGLWPISRAHDCIYSGVTFPLQPYQQI
jgi:hypothetical protein